MADIKEGKLLYHFTALENLPKILSSQLLPREQLQDFVDVADKEILTGREQHSLMSMVPFHFFANNPFDGRVCQVNSKTKFAFIVVRRVHAEAKGWKISPKHPLSGEFRLLSYADGMEETNWEVMNKRDFKTPESKNICMAECLSPNAVSPEDIHAIYVAEDEDRIEVAKLVAEMKLRIFVETKPFMFPKTYLGGALRKGKD
ncbi:DarT ssDNA thymidine ADP-ribosyltransferase family protein [Vibrio europaeus]|uniref:DarT ssDNA thymidine ADP-ribosyltransferase family protein n=1 Tax=Vibrio europaeus TaxID=300876 RepID=UPI0039DF902A